VFQLKWVWQNMEGQRKKYIFALCCTVVLTACELINPMITSQIMDTVFGPIQQGAAITSELTNRLILLVCGLIGFTLLRTSTNYIAIMTYEDCSQKLIYKLRKALYKNMQNQDQGFYAKNRTGDLMTRLTGDMDMIRYAVAFIFRMLLNCVILFTTTTVIFFTRDWIFTLCLLAATPLIFLITVRYAKRVGPLYVDLREKLSQMNIRAQENISGNRVVKAFAREDYEEERFDARNRDFKGANLKAALLWLSYSPYIDGLSQSLAVAVLLIGGAFLIMGRITIGTFTLFNSLCWTLTNPMRTLGMHINDLQRFFASASKIIELYYDQPHIVDPALPQAPEGRVEGHIRFEDVSLTLGRSQVLRHIDLDIKPGETVAIMGSTGSGKTSLVSMIPRFHDVSSGRLTIDGVPVDKYPLKKLRGSIGIATQDVFLFSDTVDGNIAYGDTSLSEEEVAHWAKVADVDFVDALPEGFDTIIGERGTGLSGGQKQRIALARALAIKPSILILDDTTSAVDLETEKYIQDQLSHLEFTCTKVIVAQRISTTKRADRVVVMDEGKIIQYGTHTELSKTPGYYRDVYLLQNGLEDEMEKEAAADGTQSV